MGNELVKRDATAFLAQSQEPFTLAPKTLQEAMQYAKIISESSLCPNAFRGKPGDVLIAVQIGAELGVSPLQALANVAVINGRASLWGDLVVALVQRSGLCEYLIEEWDEPSQTSTVRIKRKGKPEKVETFSMADARRARLDKKDLYQQYPQRMCGWRAKTYAIRSEFADVLKGLAVAEEVMDFGPQATVEHEAPIRMPQMVKPEAHIAEPQAGEPSEPAANDASHEDQQSEASSEDQHPEQGELPQTDDDAGLTTVVGVSAVPFKTRTGGESTVYKITLADGRVAASFSETTYQLATQALSECLRVRAETSPGKKPGQLNIDLLEIV